MPAASLRILFRSDLGCSTTLPRPMTWLSSSTDRTPSKAETTKMARALPTIYEKSQGGFGVLSPIAEVASSDPDEDTEGAVKKLIRNHVALAGGRVRRERRRGGGAADFGSGHLRAVPVPSPPAPCRLLTPAGGTGASNGGPGDGVGDDRGLCPVTVRKRRDAGSLQRCERAWRGATGSAGHSLT